MAICPRGHRVVDSTGQEWTLRELPADENGAARYEYVYGPCADLDHCPALAAESAEVAA